MTDPLVTIGTALRSLDPPIPRRTLARILTQLEPAGLEQPLKGGTLAKTYRWSDVARAHAAWMKRKSQAPS